MADGNGASGENQNRRRLDQLEDVIQSMITLVHEQGEMHDRWHNQTMAELREQRAMIREEMGGQRETIQQLITLAREHRGEIQDLVALSREHRIDIMALFELQKKREERGG